MALPLLEHLPLIHLRIATATNVLLLLDYDGTLTPIVGRASEAFLDTETRGLIARLTRISRVKVAILSGRALNDLQWRVGVYDLIYVGNHGLEITGPGFTLNRVSSEEIQKELTPLAAKIHDLLCQVPGVVVENKKLALSVHYRHTPVNTVPKVRDVVLSCVADTAGAFRLTDGLMVFEIRPNVDWYKGTTSRWLREKFGGENPLVIYLGDDGTDESAFLALRDGIMVKVGADSETVAAYRLPGPVDVRRFLQWLADDPLAAADSSDRTLTQR